MKNSDMPATAQSNDEIAKAFMEVEGEAPNGLTKREAFAMAAMQNILSRYNPYESGYFDSSDYNLTAIHAVGLADALLKQLEVNNND